jgi:hypothetical protein
MSFSLIVHTSYRPFPDNRVHRVVEGDTLFQLADRYFAPLPRACGYGG